MRIVDLHCDTLYKHVVEGVPLDSPSNEVLLEGGADDRKLQCYAIWLPDSYSGQQAEQTAVRAAHMLRSECDRLGIKLLCPGDHPRECFERYRSTAYLTIENGLALNGKLENVGRFADLGVRTMTLTWNARNRIGDGADVRDSNGLSAFGKEVVREMEKHHMIVDISHASERLFYDVADCTSLPFVASHSNAYAVTRHRRNLKDGQIKILMERHGLIGLNFHNAFLNDRPEDACLTDILRHTEHFLSLGGEDCLCFGSDFDGGTLPKNFQNSRVYHRIAELLLHHHYSEGLIQKIFYDNALNFFENFDIREIIV